MPQPPPPARIHLIHGDQRYLVDRDARVWRARAAASQMDVEVFESPTKLDALRRSVMEIPFLDPERFILVRDAPQLSSAARRGADPPDALAALLIEAAPTTRLCLVAHNRVPAQSPVLAAIKKLSGSVVYHAPLKGREVRGWLETAAAERGLRLPPGAADHLLRTAGADLGALAGELDKLVALAASHPLNRRDVEALTAGDEPAELWGVLEQLLGPHPARGAATLGVLLDEGRSSQHLLAVLAGQARDLLLAQAILKTRGTAATVATELRIPDWRAERLVRQARTVPAARVAAWIAELHEVDRRAKAGEITDTDALRIFALRAAETIAETRRDRAPARTR